MAHDLTALELAIRVVLDASPWQDDCDVIEMPWRQERIQSVRNLISRNNEKDGKLVFAVMKCDGNVQPHPPVQRALELVTKALQDQGYEVSHDYLISQLIGLTAS